MEDGDKPASGDADGGVFVTFGGAGGFDANRGQVEFSGEPRAVDTDELDAGSGDGGGEFCEETAFDAKIFADALEAVSVEAEDMPDDGEGFEEEDSEEAGGDEEPDGGPALIEDIAKGPVPPGLDIFANVATFPGFELPEESHGDGDDEPASIAEEPGVEEVTERDFKEGLRLGCVRPGGCDCGEFIGGEVGIVGVGLRLGGSAAMSKDLFAELVDVVEGEDAKLGFGFGSGGGFDANFGDAEQAVEEVLDEVDILDARDGNGAMFLEDPALIDDEFIVEELVAEGEVPEGGNGHGDSENDKGDPEAEDTPLGCAEDGKQGGNDVALDAGGEVEGQGGWVEPAGLIEMARIERSVGEFWGRIKRHLVSLVENLG